MGLIAQALIKFKAVIILPIIVHFLTKEDIGVFRIITTSAGFLTPLITLNIFDGSGIFLSSDFNHDSVSKKYNSLLSSLLFILPLTLFISIVFLINYETTNPYWLLITAIILSSVVFKAFITPYQAYQKAKKIVFLNFLNEYGNAALTLLIIYLFIKSYYSLFIPVVIMQLMLSIYLFFDINKEIKLKYYFDKVFIKKVIKVSIPLLPVYIGEWILASVSIYFLESFHGLNDVGIYSVAFSIASLILILRATLQYFWFSTATNLLQNKNYEQFRLLYVNIIKVYISLIVLGILFYTFYSDLLIKILANDSFLGATEPTLILSVGFGLFVLSGIFNGILYAIGATKKIFYGYLFSAVISICLSYYFVREYGVLGAAYSSLVGYTSLAFYLFMMVKREVKLGISKHYNKLIKISILFSVSTACISLINLDKVYFQILGVFITLLFILSLFLFEVIDYRIYKQILKR